MSSTTVQTKSKKAEPLNPAPPKRSLRNARCGAQLAPQAERGIGPGLRGGAPREKLTNRRKSPQRRFLAGKFLKILELLKNDFGVFPKSSFVALNQFLTFPSEFTFFQSYENPELQSGRLIFVQLLQKLTQ